MFFRPPYSSAYVETGLTNSSPIWLRVAGGFGGFSPLILPIYRRSSIQFTVYKRVAIELFPSSRPVRWTPDLNANILRKSTIDFRIIMAAGKQDAFWTLPQAIAWVCTGEAFADSKLRGPATSDQLRILALAYQSKRQLRVRVTLHAPKINWARAGLRCTISEALMQLEAWAKNEMITTRAIDPASGKRRTAIPASGTKLLIPPYSPGDRFGFWDDGKFKWAFLEPEFLVSDLKRVFPERLSKAAQKIRLPSQIQDKLHELAREHGRVKFANALVECLRIEGCNREAVRNAWKKFPSELKFKAGRPSKKTPK